MLGLGWDQLGMLGILQLGMLEEGMLEEGMLESAEAHGFRAW